MTYPALTTVSIMYADSQHFASGTDVGIGVLTRFLQGRHAALSALAEDADEWLNDSEEQMQAEDAVWDAAYARHKDKFLTLREAARTEIEANAIEERSWR